MRLTSADVRTGIVLLLGAATGIVGMWAGMHRAPIEAELKMSQKIFYFHMPLGVWTIVATVVAACAGTWCLARRDLRADALCEACMEVSVVTCGVVLVTGALWAKPAWDDWFPWGEPRVTSMLMLFLIGLSYLVVRSSVDERRRRARLSSVIAIVGALDALLAYFAIHIWNTTHPRVITPRGVALQADMLTALLICLVATGLLTWALVEARYRLACVRSEVEELGYEAERILEMRR